jgi:hypothetical protein
MAEFLKIVLYFVASIALIWGFFAALLGQSAIHEILTAVYFLIFTVAIGATAVMAEIRRQARGQPRPDSR